MIISEQITYLADTLHTALGKKGNLQDIIKASYVNILINKEAIMKDLIGRDCLQPPEYALSLLVKGIMKETEFKNVPEVCYLYVMQAGENTKIGISKTPSVRERTLSAQDPAINTVYFYKFSSREVCKDYEKRLHLVYDFWRVRGEWFKLDKNQVETLINYLKSLDV